MTKQTREPRTVDSWDEDQPADIWHDAPVSARSARASAIPESIPRDQYVSLIESLGFNAHDLFEMTFTPADICVTVAARSEYKGRGRLLELEAGAVAKRQIRIPVGSA